MSYNIQLNISNCRTENFTYNFNHNYTTFEDLLEYISFLYPNYNLCHCFKFFFDNNQNLISIKNEDKISSYSPQNNNNSLHLLITKDKNICSCNLSLKESFKKTKNEIISDSDKINQLEQQIDNLNNEINNLKISNENKDLTINDLKEKIIVLQMLINNNYYNNFEIRNEQNFKTNCLDKISFPNFKANGFEPAYNYYKKDDKMIIRVEAPGNICIESRCEYIGESIVIKISGNKKKDKEPQDLKENIFNSRQFGNFSLDIPLKSEEYLIKNEKPDIISKLGVFIITYKLEEKNKTEKNTNNINEEDEFEKK